MTLDSPDVHVWAVKLMASDRGATACERLLSPEEAERHAQYRDARTSRCYALSHGVLRTLLGRYLGMAPEQIAYREGRSGKPALAMDGAPLAFNMSHAGELAVYAFARDCQVGIDVELVRPMVDLLSVAARFFSPAEYSELMGLDEAEQIPAFYRCWTRKEAYIKGTGEGLSAELDRFRVSLLPGQPAALLSAAEPHAGRWHMHHFEPEKDYIGAVAHDGGAHTIQEQTLVCAEEILTW